MKKLAALLFAFVLVAQEKVDLSAVHRIKSEAFENSKVADLALQLTDRNGSRLTNSPSFRKACDWAAQQLKDWGLQNVKIEKWPFGRGWSAPKFSAYMIEPDQATLIIQPRPWTSGTNGPVTAEAVLITASASDAETTKLIEKYKGRLKGKIVLTSDPAPVQPQREALWRRYTQAEIDEQDRAPELGGEGGRFRGGAGMAQRNRIAAFLRNEGVAALISESSQQGGTVSVMPGGSRDPKDTPAPPSAMLAAEHYNRIARLLQKDIPVKLQIDIEARFHDDSLDGLNVVAEIPGATKPGEVVMIGAHIDSWTGGTGALDDGAGAITAMETMRILKALNLKMDRTVRIGLWGGEEQGLLGSRAYVKERFGDPRSGPVTSDYSKFSVYFNLDYGSGKIRGVYLDGNDMARPIFEKWFEPFKDMGVEAIAIRRIPYGGSDHSSFTAPGLPGFMFMQDPLDYFARLHTNMDSWDHASPTDMQQNAAILASLAYHAATRDELFPRKPLPAGVVVKSSFKPDIEYAQAAGESLKLDAWVPDGDGPFPAVIIAHGGGWRSGDKQNIKPLFEPLQKGGFAWFSINYRLAPKHRYPAAVEDLEAAIRWVKANAKEYKVDLDRIALMGDSAGGYLVSMVGASKNPALRRKAVVPIFGRQDFLFNVRTFADISENAQVFFDIAELDAAARKRLRQVSPIAYVRKGLPPYLFIHGTKDPTVPFEQSPHMCDTLKKAGNTCEVLPVEGGGHGINGWEKNPEMLTYKTKMVEWLQATLK